MFGGEGVKSSKKFVEFALLLTGAWETGFVNAWAPVRGFGYYFLGYILGCGGFY